ncbi:Kelch repeat-containing protein [Colletotrichum tanaceti]|uniref:Kelch repeat-containing protein n=1 Tax=Colletotrichum tanaceti TaxID=1306861 RepID=A0A4U6XGM5_9PEZI|nr:Kelch repeat-containing protein [Colletotrichum tanaceti]TKW54861.1 Kelch repeat-containing protein [Colletotrichum tanaceti]
MGFLHCVWLVAFAGLVAGQYDGWDLEKGQVSSEMCFWYSPRAAVIRDTLWLDGGRLYWTPTYRDGTEGPPETLDNPLGLMYSLNFSKPFDKTTNITSLIATKSKALGGVGNANSLAPNTIDGALLHNDAEFFLYGGVLSKRTDAFDLPLGDRVMALRLHAYGPEKPSFQNGSADSHALGDDVTRYVAHGGAASAPSENKAWYVGGLRSPLWGEMYMSNPNRSLNVVDASNTLITLDMSEQLFEKFSNQSLPSNIRARANPEVVWVPVGAEGVLVVLGGVTYPEYVNLGHKSEDAVKSQQESPAFMETIDIYDVAGNKWYQQKTEGIKPPALARGCAVLAPAQDYSSFSIYYYGGYDGISAQEDFSDDVWVLSIPSFQWTKVYEGRALHARAGHRCVMPYPDQMMVVGGYTAMPGRGSPPCLEGGVIQVFNLSSAEWLDGYSPSKWSNYTIPTAVVSKIGGDARGSATKTQPEGSGWADPSLAAIFATPYETSKIQTWYPYIESKETSRPTIPDGENGNGGGGGGGTPKWVAPVLGVVLGLVFITAILVGFCLWRRRRVLRRGNGTATQTDENGSRIISWIRGQPSEPAKAPTVTTEETLSNQDMAEVRTPPPPPAASSAAPRYFVHEVADTQIIAELPDTSPRPELHGVGLTPVEIINKHTRFGTGQGSDAVPNQSSYYASVSSNENASTLSRSSGVLGYQTRAQSPEPGSASGPPSSPIGTAVEPASAGGRRVGSDVSGLSDRDAKHLRSLSEATVSSASSGGEQGGVGGGGSTTAAREQQQQQPRGVPTTVPETPTLGHPSPLSPPTGASDGEDYISARMLPVSPAGTGTMRRSMFHESEDDLGSRR